MTTRALSAYEAWTVADAKAREAEAVLASAWRGYYGGRGPPPADELVQEVAQLRLEASERLGIAMAAIGAAKRRNDLSC